MSRYLKNILVFVFGVIIPEIIVLIYNRFYFNNFIFIFQNYLLVLMLFSGIYLAWINLSFFKKELSSQRFIALGLAALSFGVVFYASGMLIVLSAVNHMGF